MKNARSIFLPIILVVSYLLAACGAALPAGAETKKNSDGSLQVEFAGKVEAIDGNLWTIDGQTFEIGDPALVNGNLKVGDSVHVSATVNPDGSIKIGRVEAYQANPEPAKTQVAEATVSSGGTSDVSSTPIAGAPTSDSMSAASGNNVPAAATGTTEREGEVIGTVSAINGNQWVIGGQTFAVTNVTEFKDFPVVGDLVKVHAISNSDGMFTMIEIELAPAAATPVPKTSTSNSPGQSSNNDDDDDDDQDHNDDYGSDD